MVKTPTKKSTIDWLQENIGARANVRKAVHLLCNDGVERELVWWQDDLTIDEYQKGQSFLNGDDLTDFALQLLVKKAVDESGRKMFSPDALIGFKHLRKSEADKILIALCKDSVEGDASNLDMKSLDGSAET